MDQRNSEKLAKFKEEMQKDASHENQAIPSTEPLDYYEHMEHRQHHNFGSKANQAVIEEKRNESGQPNQITEPTEQTSQEKQQEAPRVSWKEKHPELYQEMVDNGVPLNPEELKKKGYKFGRGSKGEEFVYYPTPEYSEWLAQDAPIKEMPWPQRETLKERKARIEKEQEERREQAEQEKRQATLEKRRETIYQNGLRNLNIEEQVVGDLCKDMFPDFDLPEAEKRDAVLLASRWLDKRRDALEQGDSGTSVYRKACINQMSKQISSNSSDYEDISLEQYTDTYCGYLDKEYAVRNVQEKRKPKYSSRSIDVAQKILTDSQKDLLAKEFEKKFDSINPDEKHQEEEKALRALISAGFMGEDVEDKSNSINSLFEKTGLNKDDVNISPEVIVGCTSKRLSGESQALARERFANFFGLDDRVCEILDRRGYNGLKRLGYPNNLIFSWQESRRILPRELTPKALAKADRYLNDIIDTISHDEGFLKAERELVESRTKRSEEKTRRDLYFWSSEWDTDEYDFLSDLGRGKIYPDVNKEMERIARDIALDSGHRSILPIDGGDAGYEMLALEASHIYSTPDHRDTVRKVLMERLSKGVEKWEERRHVRSRYESDGHWDRYGGRWHWKLPTGTERYVQQIESSRKTRYLTDIFETNSFKENQEQIGLDFANPEVFDAAFSGFIETIKTTNGETSEQANWYSDNIFAHNPEKFLSQLKAYREGCSRGVKTKINRFLKQNDMVAEFYHQQQLKQTSEMMRRQGEAESMDRQPAEIMGTTEDDVEAMIAPEVSVLQKANQNDVLSLVRRRQEELVTAIEGMGAEKVRTFPFAKEFPAERGEVDNINGQSGQKAPTDFGVEKIEAEMKYYNFIRENIPDSNPQWFIDSFPGEDRIVENPENRFDGVKLDSPRSYIGFSFNYEGKLCVVAESFGDPAAMYLFCGEPDSNFKRMFDMSKLDARMDANVATVNHLDRQHIDEDLDASYQRAFMFFRTGDKNLVHYGSIGTRGEWETRQDEAFPAWPLGVAEDYGEYGDDIERYRAWQANQMNSRSNAVA